MSLNIFDGGLSGLTFSLDLWMEKWWETECESEITYIYICITLAGWWLDIYIYIHIYITYYCTCNDWCRWFMPPCWSRKYIPSGTCNQTWQWKILHLVQGLSSQLWWHWRLYKPITAKIILLVVQLQYTYMRCIFHCIYTRACTHTHTHTVIIYIYVYT